MLKEFQPKKIRKCKIKGNMQLFECGPNRTSFEWTEHINNYTNEHSEGGGGWSIIKFSLESLFEQRQLLRNKWTQSNVLMPLCRYNGCKFKFYRMYDIDYLVHYNLCLPMYDTVFQHTNAQPSNMLLTYKTIIVGCKKRNPNKRNYIKKRLRPPEQFQNKWYFQSQLNKQPLVLLTTAACDLDRYYLNPKSRSNNTSITVLNISLFQNPDFQQHNINTQYWKPNNNVYLYGTLNGDTDPQLKSLIFLGQTKSNTPGIPINTQEWTTYSATATQNINFGNPFYHHYIHGTYTIFKSKTPPNELFANTSDRNIKASTKQVTPNTEKIFTTIRYNPDRDKGDTNKCWLVKDTAQTWDPPAEESVQYSGFPLWCLLWGWPDWQRKLGTYSKIMDSCILVIESKETYPTYNRFVPIDTTFLNGYSPYLESITPSDATSWHPKLKHQQQQVENICQSGPATIKTSTLSIEAHCNYCFYFKWGGCPNELQNIKDPGEQTKYPIPNNILQETEIDDPKTDPKTCIWPFDIRRSTITKKCATRIRKDSETDSISITGSKLQPEPMLCQSNQILQTPDISSAEEEEKETQNKELLHKLRKQRRKLQLQLLQLTSQTPSIKY